MIPHRFDSWESYFYPETIAWTGLGTLRNKLGERDAVVLRVKEYGRAQVRERDLLSGSVPLARTYDADHVRALHRHLFQDVYEWAGEYRTVNITKGQGRSFGDVTTGEVDRYLADVQRFVAGAGWGRLDRDQFAERAATVFAHLNQAHPFREGNGRTSKVFLEHVAEGSRFTFDYSRVTPQEWNQASELSRPGYGRYEPVPDQLGPVFQAIVQDRLGGPKSTGPGSSLARSASLRAAAYPQAATRATQQNTTPSPQASRSGPYLPGRGTGSGIGK